MGVVAVVNVEVSKSNAREGCEPFIFESLALFAPIGVCVVYLRLFSAVLDYVIVIVPYKVA